MHRSHVLSNMENLAILRCCFVKKVKEMNKELLSTQQ